jgi:hypothetical protein
VSGEGELHARSEDAHARVAHAFRGAQEDGLGEVHLPGDALHERRGELDRVGEHAQRIAPEDAVREDVESQKGKVHGLVLVTPG